MQLYSIKHKKRCYGAKQDGGDAINDCCDAAPQKKPSDFSLFFAKKYKTSYTNFDENKNIVT